MFELNKLYNMDCMEGMKHFPNKYFDLAIVDPPYGIDINKSGRLVREKGWQYKDWDKRTPIKEYWIELNRISEKRIVWGGNYFNLGPARCYLIWDKKQPEKISFASAELAWTNFNESTKTFYYHPQYKNNNRIHPTQKPIQLYEWILRKYAKPDFKIIDTHAGSCSSVIAFLDYGCDWIAFEIDKDYYEAASKRIENHKKQLRLF